MNASITIDNQIFSFDYLSPLDISIPLHKGLHNPRAWFCEEVIIEPVKAEGFIGDVNQGGSVNFRNISFNPHGHGTHTECVGHISKEDYTIYNTLKTYFFKAILISIEPKQINEDWVFELEQFIPYFSSIKGNKAVIIRTLPNKSDKLTKNYTNSNPPYFDARIADELVKLGVDHFLVDLPSVDREYDEGKLDFHHRFWQYPSNPRLNATITELIYVADEIKDGEYILHLSIPSFQNDAAPSKPTLYKILSA